MMHHHCKRDTIIGGTCLRTRIDKNDKTALSQKNQTVTWSKPMYMWLNQSVSLRHVKVKTVGIASLS
jgi:hypothetical protein